MLFVMHCNAHRFRRRIRDHNAFFLVPQERKEEIEQKKEREKEILIFFYEGGSLPDRSYDKG